MRFGNDEIKPNDMKEDAKSRDDHVSQTDFDVDEHHDNACRDESQMFYNCLNDNKDNIDACQQTIDDLHDCKRNFAKYQPKSGIDHA